MKNFCTFIIFILLIVIIFGFFINFTDKRSSYIYECTDYKGDIIYCTSVLSYYGSMKGYKKDGTKVQITSYKKIYNNPELLEEED